MRALLLLVLLAGCRSDAKGPPDSEITAPPRADPYACRGPADCFRGGCNGEVCAAEGMVSPCVYKAEFACLTPELTECTCLNGRCGFRESPEYLACVEKARAEAAPAEDAPR